MSRTIQSLHTHIKPLILRISCTVLVRHARNAGMSTSYNLHQPISAPRVRHGTLVAYMAAMTKSGNDPTLRILLVDESLERAALLRRALQQAGCHIAAHVSSTADLTGLVEELQPDLIIVDIDSPDRDTLEQICVANRDKPRPIVMFTHDDDSEKIKLAVRAGVSAYVVDGLKSERLKPVMDVAIARFEEFQAMRRDLERAEAKLAERKDVDRAKGILMRQRDWTEDEAYQALRKMAMEKGLKIGEVARQVVTVSELLG
jgi:response regulator NasT